MVSIVKTLLADTADKLKTVTSPYYLSFFFEEGNTQR